MKISKDDIISVISHRRCLIWFTIIVIVGVGIVAKFKMRSAEGIIVVSGGETIVARDINIGELEKSSSAEAAQKLYYYYEFAEEDEKTPVNGIKSGIEGLQSPIVPKGPAPNDRHSPFIFSSPVRGCLGK